MAIKIVTAKGPEVERRTYSRSLTHSDTLEMPEIVEFHDQEVRRHYGVPLEAVRTEELVAPGLVRYTWTWYETSFE